MPTVLDPYPIAQALAARRSLSVADALLVVDEVGPEDAEAVIRRAEAAGMSPVAVARGWTITDEATA